MPTLLLAPILFFMVSLVFSMLGMGGAQLYIPILFWLGLDFKHEAIPLGMLLNVVSSSSSAVTYARRGMVDWRMALPFGGAMVVLAPLGAWANITLPTKPVILTFAIFTGAAGALMLSGWKPRRGHLTPRGRTILGVVAGAVLGFFAGLIGRGGGSFVVPLLCIAGLDPRAAAAASSVVVTFSGTSSFLSHVMTAARPDWPLWSLCAVAVLAGSQIGSRIMATRLESRSVKIVFGVVLLGVAALLVVKDVILGS